MRSWVLTPAETSGASKTATGKAHFSIVAWPIHYGRPVADLGGGLGGASPPIGSEAAILYSYPTAF